MGLPVVYGQAWRSIDDTVYAIILTFLGIISAHCCNATGGLVFTQRRSVESDSLLECRLARRMSFIPYAATAATAVVVVVAVAGAGHARLHRRGGGAD